MSICQRKRVTPALGNSTRWKDVHIYIITARRSRQEYSWTLQWILGAWKQASLGHSSKARISSFSREITRERAM